MDHMSPPQSAPSKYRNVAFSSINELKIRALSANSKIEPHGNGVQILTGLPKAVT